MYKVPESILAKIRALLDDYSSSSDFTLESIKKRDAEAKVLINILDVNFLDIKE